MRLSLTIAASLVLGSVGATAALAAPSLPQPGVIAGHSVEQVRENNRYGSMKRRKRRANTRHHGHPNSGNPALQGHQQNVGGTAGGPRH